MKLSFRVIGTPAAQGSKRFVGNGVMVESSKRVRPWRQDVKAAVCAAIGGNHPALLFDGAVVVDAAYYFPRPKSHYRTGRNAHLLKDSAARFFVATKPDIEKVVRSTHDAITEAGVWRDDAQVVELRVKKLYADERPPGAEITIEGVTP